MTFEIGQNPFIENVGRNECTSGGIAFFGLFFHGANDHAGGEEFGAEELGEFDTLSVFARHGQAENIDAAGAKPLFDYLDFFFHIVRL